MKLHPLHLPFALFSGLALAAVCASPAMAQTVAALDAPLMPSSSATSELPDAPSAVRMADPASAKDAQTVPTHQPVAEKFQTIILPGQTAQPLHGMEKAVYGFRDTFSVTNFAGITVSAAWSQLIDSEPHYGRDAAAFGKREGVAALRSTIQTMTTDAIFSPMFHDDPRYYAMGDGHGFFNRVFYAASRVVVTRSSHSTQQRINAPLLLGYAVTAGANNAYYPDQDRGGRQTARNWGTSLAGAALGFEVDEFLDDALRIVHLRKD
jgi:hypothetical protein